MQILVFKPRASNKNRCKIICIYWLSGGEYLARGYDLRAERSENRTSNWWPRAKYFPIRPDETQSIRILLNDHVEIFFQV